MKKTWVSNTIGGIQCKNGLLFAGLRIRLQSVSSWLAGWLMQAKAPQTRSRAWDPMLKHASAHELTVLPFLESV